MTLEKALEKKIDEVAGNVLECTGILLKTHDPSITADKVRLNGVLLRKLLSMQKQLTNVQT